VNVVRTRGEALVLLPADVFRLAAWDLGSLLAELAGRPVSLHLERAEFHGLLTGAAA
jgi:hypothetical protein